jgi:hypothetical protein
MAINSLRGGRKAGGSANAARGSSVQQQDLDVPGGPFDIQPHCARIALQDQIGGGIADLQVADRQPVQTLGQVRVLDDDPVEAGVDPDTQTRLQQHEYGT